MCYSSSTKQIRVPQEKPANVSSPLSPHIALLTPNEKITSVGKFNAIISLTGSFYDFVRAGL